MKIEFEKNATEPILKVIEKYQEYLTKPENLPQLAKLGYMFSKLWYDGRTSFGYSGTINKSDQCENNPKYELQDSIDYVSEEIENLVYDAWGMHYTGDESISFEDFKDLILNGKPLTELQIKELKPNKTFDEWVEIWKLKYKEGRDYTANYLLCVIGTGMGYNSKTGFIFKEASGADQDQTLYGDWMNAKFKPEIQEVVDKVLSYEYTEIAVNERKKVVDECNKEKAAKDKSMYSSLLDGIDLDGVDNVDDLSIEEIMNIFKKSVKKSSKKSKGKKVKKVKKEKPIKYYPICDYSIIDKLDKNSHISYTKEAINICQNILRNPETSSEENHNKGNLEYAKKFLKKDFILDYLRKNKIDNIVNKDVIEELDYNFGESVELSNGKKCWENLNGDVYSHIFYDLKTKEWSSDFKDYRKDFDGDIKVKSDGSNILEFIEYVNNY